MKHLTMKSIQKSKGWRVFFSAVLVLGLMPTLSLPTSASADEKTADASQDTITTTVDDSTLAAVQAETTTIDDSITYTKIEDVEVPDVVDIKALLSSKVKQDITSNDPPSGTDVANEEAATLASEESGETNSLDAVAEETPNIEQSTNEPSAHNPFDASGKAADDLTDTGARLRVKATLIDASGYNGETIEEIMTDDIKSIDLFLMQPEYAAALYDFGSDDFYAAYVDMAYTTGTANQSATDWQIAADNYNGESIDSAYYDSNTGIAYFPKAWIDNYDNSDGVDYGYQGQVQLLYPYTLSGSETSANTATSNVEITNTNTGETVSSAVTQSIFDQSTNVQLTSQEDAASIDASSITVTADGVQTYSTHEADDEGSNDVNAAVYDSETGVLTIPTNTVGISSFAISLSSNDELTNAQNADVIIESDNDINTLASSGTKGAGNDLDIDTDSYFGSDFGLKYLTVDTLGNYVGKWFSCYLFKSTSSIKDDPRYNKLLYQGYSLPPTNGDFNSTNIVRATNWYVLSPFVSKPDWWTGQEPALTAIENMVTNPKDWTTDGIYNGRRYYDDASGQWVWAQAPLHDSALYSDSYSSELQQLDWSYTKTEGPLLFQANCSHVNLGWKDDSSWNTGDCKVLGVDYDNKTVTLCFFASGGTGQGSDPQTASTVVRLRCYGVTGAHIELIKDSANTDITDNNPNYSLENARYGIFYGDNAEANAKDATSRAANGETIDRNKDYGGQFYTIRTDVWGHGLILNNNKTEYTAELRDYYVAEIGAPKGYKVNTTVYHVTDDPNITGENVVHYSNEGTSFKRAQIFAQHNHLGWTSNNGEYVSNVSDEPDFCKLDLLKVSSNTSVTSGNPNYSLEGAQYGVYYGENAEARAKTATEKAAKGETVEREANMYTMETDEWGHAWIKDDAGNTFHMPLRDYYVTEIKAPNGYKVNTTVYHVTEDKALTGDNVFHFVADSSGEKQASIYDKSSGWVSASGEYGNTAEEPIDDPETLIIVKYSEGRAYSANNLPEGSASLAGAVFTVKYYPDGNTSGTPTKTFTRETTAAGKLTVPSLPLGTYTVQETTAPTGYKVSGELRTYEVKRFASSATCGHTHKKPVGAHAHWVLVSGTDGNWKQTADEAITTFKEEINHGGIELQKVDKDTGQTPQGDADFSGLQYGIYNNSENTVVVNGVEYKSINSAAAENQAADGSSAYDKDAPAVYTLVTNKTGYAATPNNLLPYGDYQIKEIATSPMYALSDEKFGVDKLGQTDKQMFKVTATDTINLFKVAVQKVDKDTGQTPQGDADFSGIKFDVYNYSEAAVYVNGIKYMSLNPESKDYDANAKAISDVQMTTNKSGYAQTAKILPYGSYYLEEVSSNNKYLNDSTPTSVPVHTDDPVAIVTASDTPTKGHIHITKHDDATDESQGDASLAGITFKVYNTSANPVVVDGKTYPACTKDSLNEASVVDMLTTGDDGKTAVSKALPYGTYYVVESGTNDSMLIGDAAAKGQEVVCHPSEKEDGKTYEVNFSDPVVRGNVEVFKLDAETSKPYPLGGGDLAISISIVNKSAHEVWVKDPETNIERKVAVGEEVWHGTATPTENEDGTWSVKTPDRLLPYGTYEITETQTGKGYYPSEQTFTVQVREEGNTYKLGLNDDGTFDVTKTFVNQIKRVDLTFQKKSDTTGRHMALIPFLFVSKTTGEAHVVLTDENGIWDSQTTRGEVNKNDEAITTADGKAVVATQNEAGEYVVNNYASIKVDESKLNSANGVWFGKTHDGNITEAIDNAGGFVFDNYNVYELRVSGNAGYNLVVDTFAVLEKDGISADKNNKLIDWGTIDDKENVNPEIETEAYDGTSNDIHDAHIIAEANAVIMDRVTYRNFAKGTEYKLVAELHDSETGDAIVVDGKAVTAEQTYTPTSMTEYENGYLTMGLHFDASGLADGQKVVVFERVYANGAEVASHVDQTDVKQTITAHKPKLQTLATSGDGTKYVTLDTETTVIDSIGHKNLVENTEYTLVTELMNKATGEAVVDADGNAVKVETKYTPEEPNGNVSVTLVFDGTKFDDNAELVVFETLYKGDGVVAEHKDINDEGQTVKTQKAKLGTKAADTTDGDQTLAIDNTMSVTDTIEYTNLIVGKEYEATGTLMLKSKAEDGTITAEPYIDKDGHEVKAEATFTPDTTHGFATVVFTFNGLNLDDEAELVAYETVTRDGKEIAVHADINDSGQTVKVEKPEIGTTLKDGVDSDQNFVIDSSITLTDTVSYKGLVPGKEYKVTGTLMTKSTDDEGKEIAIEQLDKDGKAITAGATFTPETANGTVDVTFIFNGLNLKSGAEVVAYESLSQDGVELAVHADINDKSQTTTGTIPELGTTLTDGIDGDKVVSADIEVTLVDTIEYKNVIAGHTYDVTGTLMKKVVAEDGTVSEEKALDADGNPITAKGSFTANDTYGTTTVTFVFDARLLEQGTSLVAFEAVSQDGVEFAAHADINDEGQTVTIDESSIGTKAADTTDGDQTLAIDNTMSVTDTIEYTNLIVGKEYVTTGTLMLKSKAEDGTITAEPYIDKDGHEVTAEATFTPDTTHGFTTVVFEFNGLNLDDEAELVAYETVTRDGKEIAVHADINDSGQTVKVEKPEIGTTLTDALDGDKTVVADGENTVTDAISYENITAGDEYTLFGLLMDKTTNLPLITGEKWESITDEELKTFWNDVLSALGTNAQALNSTDGKFAVDDLDWAAFQAVLAKNTTIADALAMNQVTFTPEQAAASIDMSLAFDGSRFIEAEKANDVVAYEFLIHDGKLVAVHTDINDEGQTVTLAPSEIGTTLTDTTDGDHIIIPSKTAKVTDTVAYKNLIPGKEYKVTGKLMVKDTERALLVNDKEVTTEATFTPNAANGEVEVTFEFDASSLDSKKLVAFESVSKDGVEVAVHADINDEAQTVEVDKLNGAKGKEYTPSGSTTSTTGKSYSKTGINLDDYIWALAAAGVVGGGLVGYGARRIIKNRREEKAA